MDDRSLNGFCRLCLNDSLSLRNIFSSHSTAGEVVYSVLNYVYDLMIHPDDGLPPQICSPCMWKMLEFNSYKKNVHFAKAEIMKLLNEKSADSIGDCNNREDNDTSMDSDSTHSVRVNDEIDIEEWQMPAELKREPIDIEGDGIESVLHTDRNNMNIDNGSASSKVITQGIDLEPKQEENELLLDQVAVVQSIGSSDLKNCLSSEASEGTVGSPFEGESCSITQDIAVDIRDNNKEMHEKDLRDDDVLEEESTSAELSKSILNVTELSQSKPPLSKRKGFVCDICKKSFPQKVHLGCHVRVHYNERLFSCGVCGKSFKQHTVRYKHEQTHLRVKKRKSFVCDICKKSFLKKQNFVYHVRVHYDEKPFSCNICNKTFKWDFARRRHELTHLKGKTSLGMNEKGGKKELYSCAICAKNFVSKKGLSTHSNVHSDKYECNSCGKGFRSNTDLRIHSRSHTKENPIKCKVCLKCFRSKRNLNDHLLIHSSEKPFPCDTCDKRFKSKREKAQHALYHLRKD